jgi:flagellar biogenesis protein FliO
MLVAVAIVAVLIRYGVPKLLSKWNRTLSPSLNGGIRVIESAQFAAGMLYLVEARGKTLLLSVSGTQVVCLADLTGAESPAPPTFGEMLKDAAPKAAVLADTVPASDEILRRLDRLTGGLEKS